MRSIRSEELDQNDQSCNKKSTRKAQTCNHWITDLVSYRKTHTSVIVLCGKWSVGLLSLFFHKEFLIQHFMFRRLEVWNEINLDDFGESFFHFWFLVFRSNNKFSNNIVILHIAGMKSFYIWPDQLLLHMVSFIMCSSKCSNVVT